MGLSRESHFYQNYFIKAKNTFNLGKSLEVLYYLNNIYNIYYLTISNCFTLTPRSLI